MSIDFRFDCDIEDAVELLQAYHDKHVRLAGGYPPCVRRTGLGKVAVASSGHDGEPGLEFLKEEELVDWANMVLEEATRAALAWAAEQNKVDHTPAETDEVFAVAPALLRIFMGQEPDADGWEALAEFASERDLEPPTEEDGSSAPDAVARQEGEEAC